MNVVIVPVSVSRTCENDLFGLCYVQDGKMTKKLRIRVVKIIPYAIARPEASSAKINPSDMGAPLKFS